ncbi:MAG: metallophosphoesterase, partial [candidate division Zixibacteria bacterium]|nr:metallophosphoesterase [candidate division Zixibacteria bacterium]
LILLVMKLLRRVVGLAQRLSKAPTGSSFERKPDPERRSVLIAGSNLTLLGLSGVLTGYGVYEARRTPRIREVDIPLPNLPPAFDGFRIVQISDIHVGPTIQRDWVEMVVETAGKTGADMVAFTGDFVDGTVPNLREHTAPIRELTGRYGQFFVTGNHEYYSGVMPWLDEVDRLGWNILMNEHRVIEKDGARLVIAGVTDYRAGGFYPEHASDPYAAISGAPADVPRILLAHQPASVIDASNAGFDVQISGHTHGGQFFPWDNLARLAQPYISGLHRHDSKMWIYVSRGTGYWGPPVRIGQPSEITLVTLKRAPIAEAV